MLSDGTKYTRRSSVDTDTVRATLKDAARCDFTKLSRSVYFSSRNSPLPVTLFPENPLILCVHVPKMDFAVMVLEIDTFVVSSQAH